MQGIVLSRWRKRLIKRITIFCRTLLLFYSTAKRKIYILAYLILQRETIITTQITDNQLPLPHISIHEQVLYILLELHEYMCMLNARKTEHKNIQKQNTTILINFLILRSIRNALLQLESFTCVYRRKKMGMRFVFIVEAPAATKWKLYQLTDICGLKK